MHCYLSWQRPGDTGVDLRTTDTLVCNVVRPRVNQNTEKRGPHYWLKAAQHGHFYTSVMKVGALYAANNYAPWGGMWTPKEHWIRSSWKAHKLTHDMYMGLSVQSQKARPSQGAR